MSLNYRLALDLGSSSLGWAVLKLNAARQPTAIVCAGTRIFSDGRNPKDGSSLAVVRRAARAARRRRDRLIRRKQRLMNALIRHGFFPSDSTARKALVALDPYELRAKGLDHPLTAPEFARALFHLNQRRGFKSNRKTDKRESDNSVMKDAISRLKETLANNNYRTVGEWLWLRKNEGKTVRARFRQERKMADHGKAQIEKWYDFYVDRSLVEAEFDALWLKQAQLNPAIFTEPIRVELKDILLYQRKLKPVTPGRCTFFPDQKRAPLAMPSVQNFRIYQEANNLRWLNPQLQEQALTVQQRDLLADALRTNAKRSFVQIRKLLGLPSEAVFNIEDAKRSELKGSSTAAVLSKKHLFGPAWHGLSLQQQDEVVLQLLTEEDETALLSWLQDHFNLDPSRAQAVANVDLTPGYGSLSLQAIEKILPLLTSEVCTYDAAVQAAGFAHHSHIGARSNKEPLPALPYYGAALQRHVGFGTGEETDSDEKRYGRIANPTVHIGLNQVRIVVDEILSRYGHPSQVVIELARELKFSREKKREIEKQQALNQRRNERIRESVAQLLSIRPDQVKREQIHKIILWEELSFDPAERRCPYTGDQISIDRLLSAEVEIEHILPFSLTLDDSLNNKTVSLRSANRFKGNRSPWQAFGQSPIPGFDYDAIIQRAQNMPLRKRYRFAPDGYERWLNEDKDFLARALNDTRYLSRVAKEYLTLVCPDTWAIPGQLTAMLRARFGLNNADILGWNGQKDRTDHRHHAVDACVIGVTDRALLQRFADASSQSREHMSGRLVDNMPFPWPTYREHVKRAVNNLWVSHKPDHSYQKAMHNDTAYGLLGDGWVVSSKIVDGVRQRSKEKLQVIPMVSRKAMERHGLLPDGSLRPYKGYKGDSNYCIEIVRDAATGRWAGEVVSAFEAYTVIRQHGETEGWRRLRQRHSSLSGKRLVMRLMLNDVVRLEDNGCTRTMRVATVKSSGQLLLADIHEANVDSRNRNKDDPFSYTSKTAGSLQKAQGRQVTISPAGRLRDPGFPG